MAIIIQNGHLWKSEIVQNWSKIHEIDIGYVSTHVKTGC